MRSSKHFVIYFNDFPQFIIKKILTDINTDVIGVNCSLFADAIVLIGNSETELQFLLKREHIWNKSWIITFNPNKRNVIHHRSETPITDYVV